jgi:pseudaminic acid biosynthesis-associated methylase
MQAEAEMNTVELWKGDFGNAYTDRNDRSTLGAREQIWKMLLPRNVESVLEVGANIGLNLEAISQRSACELYATEPNDKARAQLENLDLVHPVNITADTADHIRFPDGIADLVFTSGVLIHVPPDKLERSLDEIYRCARRWIICGEYFAPQEEMIAYRGHPDALWRRDYGSLFLDRFPRLRCTAHMFAWKRMTGLDNLTFWVFEKQ